MPFVSLIVNLIRSDIEALDLLEGALAAARPKLFNPGPHQITYEILGSHSRDDGKQESWGEPRFHKAGQIRVALKVPEADTLPGAASPVEPWTRRTPVQMCPRFVITYH